MTHDPQLLAKPDHGWHPLFPRESGMGTDERRFDIIIVRRWLSDGTVETCPTKWKGSELRSWGQILDLYGGECTYQLISMCARTYRYQAFSPKIYLAGVPLKPFVQEPTTIPVTSVNYIHLYFEPLFPQARNQTDLRVHIMRRRKNGAWEVCPKVWKGSELNHWLRVLMEYGGGCTYRLLAEDGATGNFVAWTEKTFPEGPCKRRSFRERKTRKETPS